MKNSVDDVECFELYLKGEDCKQCFEVTKNVLYLFEAYKCYRDAGLNVSKQEWLLEYFDEVAEKMLMAVGNDAKAINISRIIGLSTKKDFSIYAIERNRDLRIYNEIVYFSEDVGFPSKEILFGNLSEKYDVDIQTIKRIYKKFIQNKDNTR